MSEFLNKGELVADSIIGVVLKTDLLLVTCLGEGILGVLEGNRYDKDDSAVLLRLERDLVSVAVEIVVTPNSKSESVALFLERLALLKFDVDDAADVVIGDAMEPKTGEPGTNTGALGLRLLFKYIFLDGGAQQ